MRRDIRFSSASGGGDIAGYVYTVPYAAPFCALQLAHGMCEYVARYEPFAAFLAAHGVALCGNDHAGHGASAAAPRDLGYFGEHGSADTVLADMRSMNDKTREMLPGLPVIMMGHSMGSFFARRYASRWPRTIAGLIISGTGGPNSMAALGICLADIIARVRGPRYRSPLLTSLIFRGYLKRIPNPATPFDWLTRDRRAVAAYVRDPLCGFPFTASAYRELLRAQRNVSNTRWACAVPKDMPVLMIGGRQDPVGGYGKGVLKVYGMLKRAGLRQMRCKLYPGARHEMLNEVNREEAYGDILAFLRRWEYS